MKSGKLTCSCIAVTPMGGQVLQKPVLFRVFFVPEKDTMLTKMRQTRKFFGIVHASYKKVQIFGNVKVGNFSGKLRFSLYIRTCWNGQRCCGLCRSWVADQNHFHVI